MKKQISWMIIPVFCACLLACNNKSESASSIAKHWCDLNGDVAKAKTDADKAKAEEKRREYEKQIEDKYKTDTAMRNQVLIEVEKCEGASEGR